MAHNQKELDNIETIKAWKEAYKRGPADFIEYYADDYVIWLPLQGMTLTSADRENWVENEAAMQESFEDFHYDVLSIHADGDLCFVEQKLHGTKKDGRKHEQYIFSILTVKDGKIAKDVTYCSMQEDFDVDHYAS